MDVVSKDKGNLARSYRKTTSTLANMQSRYYFLFWHTPLGVHSAIRRHQPPQRPVLSQVDCFVQSEVVGSQISLDGVQPRDTGTPWWSLLVLW